MGKHSLIAVIGFSLIILIACFIIPGEISATVDEGSCLACHEPEDADTIDSSIIHIESGLLDSSAHKFKDCQECHSNPHEESIEITKLTLAAACGECHQYQYNTLLESVHGEGLPEGNEDLPTCTDCHSSDGNAHNVKRVHDPDSSAFRKNIAPTCAVCHADHDLAHKYDLNDHVYESYRHDFHGKAVEHSPNDSDQMDKATCGDCHGTHNIMRADDPDSPVFSGENLTHVCQQCHEDTGVTFANTFLGHEKLSFDNHRLEFIVYVFFLCLCIGVLSFGMIMVLLATIGWLRKGWKS